MNGGGRAGHVYTSSSLGIGRKRGGSLCRSGRVGGPCGLWPLGRRYPILRSQLYDLGPEHRDRSGGERYAELDVAVAAKDKAGGVAATPFMTFGDASEGRSLNRCANWAVCYPPRIW